jgi:YihY family inner membrane protein
VTDRLDALQRRVPALGFPLAVVYKFFDDRGSYLAALISYYGFLSFFPLLLLLSSVLGYTLSGNPGLQRRVLDSALSQFPVIGNQLSSPAGLQGSATAVVVGVLASLYGGIGVAQAVQHAMNTAWGVPIVKRPNPFVARLRSLLLLGAGGLALVVTTVLAGLGTSRVAGLDLGAGLQLLSSALSVLLNAALLVLVFRIATARRLTLRQAAPGAICAAVVWLLLQSFGAAYVGRVVTRASETNGVFALVLGMLAWIYLSAVAFVLCVEINVVRVKGLYPRSLLTPFTDDVDLTSGDARAYTDLAQAQRAKGFQSVDVSFEGEGRDAHGRRIRRGAGPDRRG